MPSRVAQIYVTEFAKRSSELSDASRHFAQSLHLQEGLACNGMIQASAHAWSTYSARHSQFSWALLLQGHIGQALAARPTVLAKARELNKPHGLAVTLHQGCVFYQLLPDPREVAVSSAELIALTQEQGFAHWSATGTISAAGVSRLAASVR